jgi:hypothetical protein
MCIRPKTETTGAIESEMVATLLSLASIAASSFYRESRRGSPQGGPGSCATHLCRAESLASFDESLNGGALAGRSHVWGEAQRLRARKASSGTFVAGFDGDGAVLTAG